METLQYRCVLICYNLRSNGPGTRIKKRHCPSKPCKVDKLSFICFGALLLAAVCTWVMEYS